MSPATSNRTPLKRKPTTKYGKQKARFISQGLDRSLSTKGNYSRNNRPYVFNRDFSSSKVNCFGPADKPNKDRETPILDVIIPPLAAFFRRNFRFCVGPLFTAYLLWAMFYGGMAYYLYFSAMDILYKLQEVKLDSHNQGDVNIGVDSTVSWSAGVTPHLCVAIIVCLFFLLLAFALGLARSDGTSYVRVPDSWFAAPRLRVWLSPFGTPSFRLAAILKRRARVLLIFFIIHMIFSQRYHYIFYELLYWNTRALCKFIATISREGSKQTETLQLGEEFIRALEASREATIQIISPPFPSFTVHTLCFFTLLAAYPILKWVLLTVFKCVTRPTSTKACLPLLLVAIADPATLCIFYALSVLSTRYEDETLGYTTHCGTKNEATVRGISRATAKILSEAAACNSTTAVSWAHKAAGFTASATASKFKLVEGARPRPMLNVTPVKLAPEKPPTVFEMLMRQQEQRDIAADATAQKNNLLLTRLVQATEDSVAATVRQTDVFIKHAEVSELATVKVVSSGERIAEGLEGLAAVAKKQATPTRLFFAGVGTVTFILACTGNEHIKEWSEVLTGTIKDNVGALSSADPKLPVAADGAKSAILPEPKP